MARYDCEGCGLTEYHDHKNRPPIWRPVWRRYNDADRGFTYVVRWKCIMCFNGKEFDAES